MVNYNYDTIKDEIAWIKSIKEKCRKRHVSLRDLYIYGRFDILCLYNTIINGRYYVCSKCPLSGYSTLGCRAATIRGLR